MISRRIQVETNLWQLMCYRVSRPLFHPVGRVHTNNAFGATELFPRERRELCVPALKN
jgi:hypothetical protein